MNSANAVQRYVARRVERILLHQKQQTDAGAGTGTETGAGTGAETGAGTGVNVVTGTGKRFLSRFSNQEIIWVRYDSADAFPCIFDLSSSKTPKKLSKSRFCNGFQS